MVANGTRRPSPAPPLPLSPPGGRRARVEAADDAAVPVSSYCHTHCRGCGLPAREREPRRPEVPASNQGHPLFFRGGAQPAPVRRPPLVAQMDGLLATSTVPEYRARETLRSPTPRYPSQPLPPCPPAHREPAERRVASRQTAGVPQGAPWPAASSGARGGAPSSAGRRGENTGGTAASPPGGGQEARRAFGFFAPLPPPDAPPATLPAQRTARRRKQDCVKAGQLLCSVIREL